jgi:hypothetical protein
MLPKSIVVALTVQRLATLACTTNGVNRVELLVGHEAGVDPLDAARVIAVSPAP